MNIAWRRSAYVGLLSAAFGKRCPAGPRKVTSAIAEAKQWRGPREIGGVYFVERAICHQITCLLSQRRSSATMDAGFRYIVGAPMGQPASFFMDLVKVATSGTTLPQLSFRSTSRS